MSGCFYYNRVDSGLEGCPSLFCPWEIVMKIIFRGVVLIYGGIFGGILRKTELKYLNKTQ
jgi:hypothetical protein